MHATRRPQISGGDRIWSAVAHMAIMLPAFGILVALAVRYLNKESWYVRDHARQAIGFQIIVAVVIWGGSLLIQYLGFDGTLPETPTPEQQNLLLVLLVFTILRYVTAGYAFLAAFRAFTGREFEYALVGPWIEAFYDH